MMKEFDMMHAARIVQEILREEYDVSVESAVLMEYALYGAGMELQKHGNEVVSMYPAEGGKFVHILVLHKGEITISVPA